MSKLETAKFHQGNVLQISNPMFFDGFGAMRSVMSRPQLLSPTLILCKWPAWRHADQFLSLNGTIIRSREKRKIFLLETHRPGYGKTCTMNLANETLGEPCQNYQNCLFSASILVWEQYPRIELSLIPRIRHKQCSASSNIGTRKLVPVESRQLYIFTIPFITFNLLARYSQGSAGPQQKNELYL